jgi:hypothetical protein
MGSFLCQILVCRSRDRLQRQNSFLVSIRFHKNHRVISAAERFTQMMGRCHCFFDQTPRDKIDAGVEQFCKLEYKP